MPEKLNTTDKTIIDPNNAEAQIDNPNYKAPAPVAAPAAAAAALDLAPEPTEVNVPTTGNKTVDAVGALLSEKKVPNADKIIAEFAETGEISLSMQASLVDAMGESLALLAITQLTQEATKLQTASTESRTAVLDYANTKFNGENADTTWAQIQDFVKSPESGFSVADREAMTSMINAGGLQAQLVIDKIATVYAKDSNTTISADLLAGDSLTTGATFTPISAMDYSKELSTLMQTNAYDSPAVRTLQQRRERSRLQGIA